MIIVEEHSESKEIRPPFSQDEIMIIQRNFKNKVEIVPKLNGKHSIRAHEYVGYIILPNYIINIRPKIPGINFANMVKYALNIPKLGIEDFIADEAENFYDILVLFLLEKLKDLLKKGLYNSYVDYQENNNCVRGKILFKEHIVVNSGRNDKVFCQFSELTSDIPENRIIKSTLYNLLQIGFIDKRINSELINLYKRFDQVELVTITSDVFDFINYTSLNEHYKPILTLCKLLLSDSSLNIERIGQKTSLSFLIDMNMLFQDFIGNLLKSHFSKTVKLQKRRYPEVKDKRLKVKPDIVMTVGAHSLVLDTKYREVRSKPDESEVAQMVLYSVSTGISKCVLGLDPVH